MKCNININGKLLEFNGTDYNTLVSLRHGLKDKFSYCPTLEAFDFQKKIIKERLKLPDQKFYTYRDYWFVEERKELKQKIKWIKSIEGKNINNPVKPSILIGFSLESITEEINRDCRTPNEILIKLNNLKDQDAFDTGKIKKKSFLCYWSMHLELNKPSTLYATNRNTYSFKL